MKQTFLVKHAVGGRMFIDSNKLEVPYTLVPQGKAGDSRFLCHGAKVLKSCLHIKLS